MKTRKFNCSNRLFWFRFRKFTCSNRSLLGTPRFCLLVKVLKPWSHITVISTVTQVTPKVTHKAYIVTNITVIFSTVTKVTPKLTHQAHIVTNITVTFSTNLYSNEDTLWGEKSDSPGCFEAVSQLKPVHKHKRRVNVEIIRDKVKVVRMCSKTIINWFIKVITFCGLILDWNPPSPWTPWHRWWRWTYPCRKLLLGSDLVAGRPVHQLCTFRKKFLVNFCGSEWCSTSWCILYPFKFKLQCAWTL